MIKILTIVSPLFFTLTVKSQLSCDKSIDTIPLYFHVADTSHYYNYYNSNGVIAWRNVKGYDATLIPPGGYTIQGKNVNPKYGMISGYGVVQNNVNCRLIILRWLDTKYKDLDKKYWIEPGLLLR